VLQVFDFTFCENGTHALAKGELMEITVFLQNSSVIVLEY
jgi:hypothetical protein